MALKVELLAPFDEGPHKPGEFLTLTFMVQLVDAPTNQEDGRLTMRVKGTGPAERMAYLDLRRGTNGMRTGELTWHNPVP